MKTNLTLSAPSAVSMRVRTGVKAGSFYLPPQQVAPSRPGPAAPVEAIGARDIAAAGH